MDYIFSFQDGGSIVKSLIQKVIQSQGQDQEALQQLIQLAENGDEEALGFIQQLQQSSTVPQQKDGGMVTRSQQVSEYKNRGNMKKQVNKKIKPQVGKCGCQLKRVGGRLIEIDGCTGLPIHRNGGQVQKYWIGGNLIRGIGDWIGTNAGKVAEWAQKGWGTAQQNVGEAISSVTGGNYGNGLVERGNANVEKSQTTGANVNATIDAGAQKAGDVYDKVQRGVRTFVPGVGWVLNAADRFMDEHVGNYDANTGNVVKSDGTVNSVVTPIYDNQREMSAKQMMEAPNAADLQSKITALNPGGINAQPIRPIGPNVVKEQPIEGRYSKYGMQYTKDENGNVVEDWKNTTASNRDIARAAIADNRASYRENRNAIRNSGMSLAQQEAALREQRASRRQANQDARTWRKAQQGAYDQNQMAAFGAGAASYNKNGGIISYADYLK